MLNKRKADWLSQPVLAAAGVNPVYTYSSKDIELWKVPGADRAVRAIFAKLCWGDADALAAAIKGWGNFKAKRGIYEQESNVLSAFVYEPTEFFDHVQGTSTLQEDQIFATLATYLVNGFSSQSGAERTNKYMSEVQGRKKATQLNLQKGRIMLETKMHLMYKAARRTMHAKEQRDGESSVAADLRGVYLHRREEAKAVNEAQHRLAELRKQAKASASDEAEAAAGGEEPLVTASDVNDVLGEEEEEPDLAEPYVLPDGFTAVEQPPSDLQLVGFTTEAVLAPEVVGKRLMFNYDGYGWIGGKVVRRNGDARRRMDDGTIANFIASFDMDDGKTTALVLEREDYSSSLLAETGAWFLICPIAAESEVADEEMAESEAAPVAASKPADADAEAANANDMSAADMSAAAPSTPVRLVQPKPVATAAEPKPEPQPEPQPQPQPQPEPEPKFAKTTISVGGRSPGRLLDKPPNRGRERDDFYRSIDDVLTEFNFFDVSASGAGNNCLLYSSLIGDNRLDAKRQLDHDVVMAVISERTKIHVAMNLILDDRLANASTQSWQLGHTRRCEANIEALGDYLKEQHIALLANAFEKPIVVVSESQNEERPVQLTLYAVGWQPYTELASMLNGKGREKAAELAGQLRYGAAIWLRNPSNYHFSAIMPRGYSPLALDVSRLQIDTLVAAGTYNAQKWLLKLRLWQ